MKKDEEMISTDGIVNKINGIFKNIFKRKENIAESIEIEETQIKQQNSFEESIVVMKDEERERLLELQKRFKVGKLNPEDVTEEDIDKLTALYNEQIAELNKQIDEDIAIIERCNKQIEEYKRKQAENNQKV